MITRLSEPTSASREHTDTGATTLRLVCLANDPPEDRWLSIAETFEFLPGDEE